MRGSTVRVLKTLCRKLSSGWQGSAPCLIGLRLGFSRSSATWRFHRRGRCAEAGSRDERASLPDACFESADDQIDARKAGDLLAEIDSDLRETIVARLWGGLTFDEIATLCGCSVSTVHRRYTAGLRILQERLDTPCKTTASPQS